MSRKPLIMIVEDDLGPRESLRITLEDDYLLLFAQDGIEAVEKAKTQSLDLILMDIRLPRLNGWEAIHELRAMGNSVPIIVISASPDLLDERIAQELNVAGHINKPYDICDLKELVRKQIRYM